MLNTQEMNNLFAHDGKMRLWSISPQHLDSKGLLDVCCKDLLAQQVLLGKTKGYVNHPQLLRFKRHEILWKAISA